MWADSPLELKQKFQKLIFLKGFIYDIENDKFIINEISPLYRGNTTIKQADDAENSIAVTLPGILGYIFVALRKVNFSALLLAIEPFGFGSRARAIK